MSFCLIVRSRVDDINNNFVYSLYFGHFRDWNLSYERMYRRGETKPIVVSEFTPVNEILRNPYGDFSRFWKSQNMTFYVDFSVRDGSRGHKKSTLKSLQNF